MSTLTPRGRWTLASLARHAAAPGAAPFACLTCYDATTARWLARAGVHILLVGDTAAEMVLGFSRTVDMPLEVLIALTAGVKRGTLTAGGGGGGTQPVPPAPLVMADMPFMSYQASPDDAVRNAGRFVVEGLADIVKLEADEELAPVVARMVRAGVPICGHVGSKPQRAALTGGYAAAGRTAEQAQQIIRDAQALQAAGCSMLLIEAVPESVTAQLLEVTKVPVIGIGAGPACHGQVLVLQDLLGLTDQPPPFVQPVASLGPAIAAAAAQWVDRIAQRQGGVSPYRPREAAKPNPAV